MSSWWWFGLGALVVYLMLGMAADQDEPRSRLYDQYRGRDD